MATKRAIVFDFYGVLVDSWEHHATAWREALAEFGGSVEDEALVKVLGLSTMQSAERLVEDSDPAISPGELAAVKDERFRAAASELKPMASAVEAVKRLSELFPIAVVSQHEDGIVSEFIDRVGLRDNVSVVLSTADLNEGETFDDMLVHAAAELTTPPERIVLIEDSRNGVISGKRVGLKVIAFDSHPNFNVDYSIADAQVGSLDELVPELIAQVTAA